MIIKQYELGPLAANCYLVICEETKEAILIDPGYPDRRLEQDIQNLGAHVKYIINTHGHIDHIGGNYEMAELTHAPVLIHEKDQDMLLQVNPNQWFLNDSYQVKEADRLVEDGEILEFGNKKATVLYTPGHSLGGICILIDDAVFTGDTLFQGSIGRTDLEGGDFDTLIHSIQTKLMTLEDNVIVYPGHGSKSAIGFERKFNPFLR